MECVRWQEALSALTDGEDPGIDRRLISAHLDGCAPCRGYERRIATIVPAGRVAAAPEMPDLSRRVIRLNAIADRASRWGLIRGLLALVAVEVIVLALPALLLGREQATSAHAARHLGAFSVAYAAALLVAAVRPARARSVLPVAIVAAGALAITAVLDIAEGNVPLLGEAGHIPELLSVVLLWLLAAPGPMRWRRKSPVSASEPGLALVEETAADADRRLG